MNKRKLLKYCLRDRALPEWNYELTRKGRYWFTFKCLVAILFNRQNDKLDEDECITIASYDGQKHSSDLGIFESWTDLLISKKGWQFTEIANGSG